MRPSFLLLTPACVALGASTALASLQEIDIVRLLLVLAGALSAHASVNVLNEYYDFRSGLDLHTHRTPFNGGSGALVEYPGLALPVLGLGLALLVLTITIGTWFIFQSGIGVLLIGLMGIALIVSYTQWVNRLPVLCLIAPGLGFGLFMVIGTHVALVRESSLLALAVALVPFCLVNNLLLLSQVPDMEADRQAGRHHYVIAHGLEKTWRVYTGFVAAAYGLVMLYVATALVTLLALLALLPLPLSIFAAYGLKKHGARIGEHPPFLAANVAAAILTPVLLAIAIFIGG